MTSTALPLIRPRTPADDPAIVASFNEVFGAIWGEHYAPRTVAHLRWQYADRGAGDRAMLATDRQGRVLAFWGGMALTTDTEFGPLTFVHSCDNFAVAPERHTGLFVHLAKAAVARCLASGVALGYGFPLPAAHHVDRHHLGTRDLYEVEYLCLDSSRHLQSPAELSVARVTALCADVDALYAHTRRAYRCLTRRDAAYLSWRYLDCPTFDYRVLAARRGAQLAGIAVLRPHHELRPGACAVVDWLVPSDDHDAQVALLAMALDVARAERRTNLLTSFAPHSPERAVLLELGFAAVASRQSLNHPLAYLALDPRLEPEWLLGNWWQTLGDSDLG